MVPRRTRRGGDRFLTIWEETFLLKGQRKEDHGGCVGGNQHIASLQGCSTVTPGVMRSSEGFQLRRSYDLANFRQCKTCRMQGGL